MLYESIMLSYENPYYNYMDEEDKKEYRSYLEFQHFCKKLNLITKLLTPFENNNRFQFCTFYFVNEFDVDNNPIQFDYLNKYDNKYMLKYKDLYNKLDEYKKLYIITLDGNKDSTCIKF